MVERGGVMSDEGRVACKGSGSEVVMWGGRKDATVEGGGVGRAERGGRRGEEVEREERRESEAVALDEVSSCCK